MVRKPPPEQILQLTERCCVLHDPGSPGVQGKHRSIKGRGLPQTLPTYAYNCAKTVENTRAHSACEFEVVGISRDCFCIKIPATGPGLRACQILVQDGIRTPRVEVNMRVLTPFASRLVGSDNVDNHGIRIC
ncbi:hypothetical protein BDW67DRAFT_168274 [Aspergillus spinulosporus]